jgi:hypothetical protein
VVLLVVSGLVACGGDSSSSAERTVIVKLEARPAAGDDSGVTPPDGGLPQGHGVDIILQAKGSTATVSGRVEPADSTVLVFGPRGRVSARSRGKGRFEARVTGLHPGVNHVRVRAAAADRKTWSRKIRIVRR